MSGGLFALLDDIAALARLAAASLDDVGAAAGRASVKAAGVVVDDTAVTPQYVRGVAANRELPIVKKIAIGSLRNKLVFILPLALLLSQFLPWLLTPLLMIGGGYLCFEGAEKIWAKLSGHGAAVDHAEVVTDGRHPDEEATMVSGAIRTDFILSAEIMAISLASVSEETLLIQAAALAVVGFFIARDMGEGLLGGDRSGPALPLPGRDVGARVWLAGGGLILLVLLAVLSFMALSWRMTGYRLRHPFRRNDHASLTRRSIHPQ